MSTRYKDRHSCLSFGPSPKMFYATRRNIHGCSGLRPDDRQECLSYRKRLWETRRTWVKDALELRTVLRWRDARHLFERGGGVLAAREAGTHGDVQHRDRFVA